MLKIWFLVLAVLSCQVFVAQSKSTKSSMTVMSRLLNESTAQGLTMLDLYSLNIIERLVQNLLEHVQTAKKEKEHPVVGPFSDSKPEDLKLGEEKNELVIQVADLLFRGLHHIVERMDDKLTEKQ